MTYSAILTLAFLFVCKLLDIGFSTIKTILFYKGKNFYSSLVNSFAQYFYLAMMVSLSKDNSNIAIIIICTATFLGSYVPSLIAERFEKDKMWLYLVTAESYEAGDAFMGSIRAHNIPIAHSEIIDHDFGETICYNIFSKTKEDSKLIEAHIPGSFKYSRLETKN